MEKTARICPGCQAENPADARRCSGCGTTLPRRRKSRAGEEPVAAVTEVGNKTTLLAFRCAAVGLIPLVGLLLGPAALLLSLLAYRQEKAGPPLKMQSPALAVLTLATAITLTNWLGVLLMVYGWTSASSP